MDGRVFEIRWFFGPFEEDAARGERRVEGESFFGFAFALSGRCGSEGFHALLAVGDLRGQGLEGGIGGFELEAAVAGVGGFEEFVEGEEGGGGAVIGFDIRGVEAEGGGGVKGRAAEVSWKRACQCVGPMSEGRVCGHT